MLYPMRNLPNRVLSVKNDSKSERVTVIIKQIHGRYTGDIMSVKGEW